MIIGTGMDLVEINRIIDVIHNKRFVERILSTPEQDVFHHLTSSRRKVEFLAGRFAAKEAYAKAKGTGIGAKLSWRDMIVLNDDAGKPMLKEREIEGIQVHLSITHTREYAAAFVIIESLSG